MGFPPLLCPGPPIYPRVHCIPVFPSRGSEASRHLSSAVGATGLRRRTAEGRHRVSAPHSTCAESGLEGGKLGLGRRVRCVQSVSGRRLHLSESAPPWERGRANACTRGPCVAVDPVVAWLPSGRRRRVGPKGCSAEADRGVRLWHCGVTVALCGITITVGLVMMGAGLECIHRRGFASLRSVHRRGGGLV
ncbi:hypothetical protein PSPO01_02370 [Paraphaeosphaeria sporulosa]